MSEVFVITKKRIISAGEGDVQDRGKDGDTDWFSYALSGIIWRRAEGAAGRSWDGSN